MSLLAQWLVARRARASETAWSQGGQPAAVHVGDDVSGPVTRTDVRSGKQS
jgi:hypothetical protein